MFLPIIFACLVNGQCDFLPLPIQQSEKVCEAQLTEVAKRLDVDDTVYRYMGRCIPVQLPKGKDV